MNSFYYASSLCNVLALVALLSAVLVITVGSPVNSVLWLIVAFVATACYLVTAGMAYIGLSYIIVYVGAIAVLFLFVVMMLDITNNGLKLDRTSVSAPSNTWPLALLVVGMCYYGLYPLSVSTAFSYPASVMWVLNLPMMAWSEGLSLDIGGIEAHSWYSAVALDSSIGTLTQVQALGITLYTSGAVWLLVISLLLMLAMLVPLALCIEPVDRRHT